jgi:hypothetical protein
MRIIAHRPCDERSTALLQFASVFGELLPSNDAGPDDAGPASSAIGYLIKPLLGVG